MAITSSNPREAAAPNFTDPKYAEQVARVTPDGGAAEEGQAVLLALWKDNNALDCAAWDEEQARLQVASEQQRADAEQAAREAKKAKEDAIAKKRPKYAPLDPSLKISSSVTKLPSLAVQERMHNDKYVALWNFGEEALQDAATTAHYVPDSTFAVNSAGHLVPADAYKPHPKERRDEDLSVNEFLSAQAGYMSALEAGERGEDFIQDTLSFFYAILSHPLREQGDIGWRTLMAYVGEVRREQARAIVLSGFAPPLKRINEKKMLGLKDQLTAEGLVFPLVYSIET